jgi:hypothetical protein
MRTLIIFLCFINFSYAQKNQYRISDVLSPQLVKNLSQSNQIIKRFYEYRGFNYNTGLHLRFNLDISLGTSYGWLLI